MRTRALVVGFLALACNKRDNDFDRSKNDYIEHTTFKWTVSANDRDLITPAASGHLAPKLARWSCSYTAEPAPDPHSMAYQNGPVQKGDLRCSSTNHVVVETGVECREKSKDCEQTALRVADQSGSLDMRMGCASKMGHCEVVRRPDLRLPPSTTVDAGASTPRFMWRVGGEPVTTTTGVMAKAPPGWACGWSITTAGDVETGLISCTRDGERVETAAVCSPTASGSNGMTIRDGDHVDRVAIECSLTTP